MIVSIPKEINNAEILVRYLFSDDFKKKVIQPERLNFGEIFMPYKGGVSLQRADYCDENECKIRAKIIPKNYIGFVIFRKATFEEVKAHYIEHSRKNFEAEIIASPMMEDFTYFPENTPIFLNTPGNPSHADLKYINPAPTEDESPKTAIRSFSRKFSKSCLLIIDEDSQNQFYKGKSFRSVI